MFSWIVCQVSAGGVLVAVRDSRYMQSQGTNKEGNNSDNDRTIFIYIYPASIEIKLLYYVPTEMYRTLQVFSM